MLTVTENPWPAVLLCWVVMVCAGAMWYFVARHGLPLAIALLAGVASVAILAISLLTVTDQEKIRSTIRNLADAVHNNDAEGVVRWIASDAQGTRADARREMDLCTFSQCWVTKIEPIQFGGDGQRADVVVVIYCSATHQVHGEGAAFVRLFLDLKREADGEWRLSKFNYSIE